MNTEELRRLAEQAKAADPSLITDADQRAYDAFNDALEPAAILSLLDELDEAKWDLVRRGERVAALEEGLRAAETRLTNALNAEPGDEQAIWRVRDQLRSILQESEAPRG